MEKYQNIKSPENVSNEEETFRQYFDELELKPEDFNKVILDVGAGEAYFAKWAKDHNVCSTIYSLEPFQKMMENEKNLVGYAEEIPMPDKSFDMIVSNGAIPNIYLGEKDVKEKVEKGFSEMIRVLKDGGEIKIARVLIGNKYENQKILANCIKETLDHLKEKFNIDIKMTHTPINDTYEYDENKNRKNLLAESFLIVLQKPKKEVV